ncbi:MAG: HNH endonuclease [Oligoflexia bacterium]|nr:HNH endonuclease [Oligoflexia bacterium]
MAEVLPKAKLEKEIAKVLPEKAVQERTSYVSPERIKLTVGLSERAHELLKRVQDLECQRRRASINFEQTIEAALELYIKKLDPVEKAKARFESEVKTTDAAASVPGHIVGLYGFTRVRLPQRLKHQIFLRDKGECQHRDQSGNKCHNSRWTEVHHKTPVSHGGQNELNNLTTLCFGHHKLMHL